MKLEIIETADYILAVSDEEINKDELGIDGTIIGYFDLDEEGCPILKSSAHKSGYSFSLAPHSKKIIAYQPKGNALELDLPLLPEIIEDDVEELAKEYLFNVYQEIFLVETNSEQFAVIKGFIEGYKIATKVYNEDDLRKAIGMAREGKIKQGYDHYVDYDFKTDEIIQSLKQPKPKWFVVETKRDYKYKFSGTEKEDGGFYGFNKLKTTTINGKIYLAGKYLNK
jgi:hypothetical protein